MSQIIIAVVITAVIVAFLSWNLAIEHRKKDYESKIGSAEVKSREIIEEALKTAETKKREAMLEAKEEAKSGNRPCSRRKRALRREAVREIPSTTEEWKSLSASRDSRSSRRRSSCSDRSRTM